MNSAAQASEIQFRIALRADRSRIFYALTLPEYMELWAGDASAISVTCESKSRDGGTFRLVSSLANGSTFIIKGKVEEYRPMRKVVFVWSHRVSGWDSESRVTINVLSRKTHVLVSIGHSGLSTQAERRYFQDLWTKCTGWLFTSFDQETHRPLAINGGGLCRVLKAKWDTHWR